MNIWWLTHTVYGVIFFVILTAVVGSFLNVVIYRLPLMLQAQWQSDCRAILKLEAHESPPIFNLCWPRSQCPHCQAPIPAWHNIPLLSYVILAARCAHCHATISWRYPFVEFMCMLLSAVALCFVGWHVSLIFYLLFIWIIICLCMIDLEHQMLPDSLVYCLLWLGLIANIHDHFTTLPYAVWAAVFAYVGLWSIIKIYALITGKQGMGYGDLKLFAALGAWFGPLLLPAILLCASLCGSVVSGIYLVWCRKSKDTPLPFGPFLGMAGILCLFFHEMLTSR